MRITRHVTSVVLVALFLALAGLVIAACKSGGGGGSAGPCCTATGQTEAPPAFAAAGGFAQAFILSSPASCITLDATGAPLLPADAKPAGPKTPLTGSRYTVDINARGDGQQVIIAISNGSGKVAGVAAVPTDSAGNGVSYHVAPIEFLSGVGEGTLELAYYCEMQKRPAIAPGDMTLADVRTLISKRLTSDFNATGNFDLSNNPALDDALIKFRAGLAAVVAAAGPQKQVFEHLRDVAQVEVDACRDGVTADPLSGITCDGTEPVSEFYRFWVITNRAATVAPALAPQIPAALSSWAEVLGLQHGANPGTVAGLDALFRGQMMRLLAARAVIYSESQQLSLTTAVPTALGTLDAIRDAGLTAGSAGTMTAAWQANASALISGLAADNGSTAGGCGLENTPFSDGATQWVAVENTFDNTTTVAQILPQFDPTNPAAPYGKIDFDLDNPTNCLALTGPANLAARHAWDDIIGQIALNASPYPK